LSFKGNWFSTGDFYPQNMAAAVGNTKAEVGASTPSSTSSIAKAAAVPSSALEIVLPEALSGAPISLSAACSKSPATVVVALRHFA
jgi:hypothetical protein